MGWEEEEKEEEEEGSCWVGREGGVAGRGGGKSEWFYRAFIMADAACACGEALMNGPHRRARSVLTHSSGQS